MKRFSCWIHLYGSCIQIISKHWEIKQNTITLISLYGVYRKVWWFKPHGKYIYTKRDISNSIWIHKTLFWRDGTCNGWDIIKRNTTWSHRIYELQLFVLKESCLSGPRSINNPTFQGLYIYMYVLWKTWLSKKGHIYTTKGTSSPILRRNGEDKVTWCATKV